MASAPGTALSDGPAGSTVGIGAGAAFVLEAVPPLPAGLATGATEGAGIVGAADPTVPLPLAGIGAANGLVLPVAGRA